LFEEKFRRVRHIYKGKTGRDTTAIYVHGRVRVRACSSVFVRVGARTSVDANIEDSDKAKKGMGQPPTAERYVWQQCWDWTS